MTCSVQFGISAPAMPAELCWVTVNMQRAACVQNTFISEANENSVSDLGKVILIDIS